MLGTGIINKYVIDGLDYSLQELNPAQLAMVESIADKGKYNQLRNQILSTCGPDVKCTVRVIFPGQEMEVIMLDRNNSSF